MARFEVEIDGQRYEIEAPDEAGLAAAVQSIRGQSQPAAAPAAPAAPDSTPLMERSAAPGDADPFAPVKGVLGQAGAGVLSGVAGLATLPGNLQEMFAQIGEYVGDKAFGKPGLGAAMRQMGGKPYTTADLLRDAKPVIGELPEPKTTAEQYARTIGEFAPNAIFPGSAAQRIVGTVVPALASETAGQATKGTPNEGVARFAAGALAPLAVTGAAAIRTPVVATSPERTRLSGVLDAEGVTAQTAGQRTGSIPLQYMESGLGAMPGAGNRAARIQSDQGEQFTRAALRRTGTQADRATSGVIDDTFNRIGAEFDRLVPLAQVQIDPRVQRILRTAELRYNQIVPEAAQSPLLRAGHQHNIIDDMVNRGTVPGDVYQEYRSRLSRMARETSDPTLARTLQDIVETLDDGAARSLQPADADAFTIARNQYRNLMAIEKAASGAGSATAEGLLSPSQLRGAVQNQNRRSYVRGQGDMADLARAGEAILRPLPNSGTAQRNASFAVPAALASAAGQLAAGQPRMAAITAAAALGPSVAGRALMSRTVQSHLGNQSLADFRRDVTAGTTLPRSTVGAAASADDPMESNQTFQYLVRRGITPDEAADAVRNPEALAAILRLLQTPEPVQ